MDVVYHLVLVIHLLGMAAVVGGYLSVLRRPRVLGLMRDGAGTALVAGLGLGGLGGSNSLAKDFNHTKLAVKLVVAIAVLVAAIIGARRDKDGRDSATLAHVAGGLAVANVL